MGEARIGNSVAGALTQGRSQLGCGWGQSHLDLVGPTSPSVRAETGASFQNRTATLLGRERGLDRHPLSDWPLLESRQFTFYPRPLLLSQWEGRPWAAENCPSGGDV